MVLLFILCLTFGLRIAPRLIVGNRICSDSYFHLAMARAIQGNGHRIPDRIDRIIVPHRFLYPFLYHWLMSFFSAKGVQAFERMSGAVIDTVYVFVSYLFSFQLMRAVGQDGAAHRVALWTALLVAFSPALLRVGSGPRAYQGSPRPLGQLWLLIYMGALFGFSASQNHAWLLLSILAVGFMVVTSKFSNQVAILFGMSLCVFGQFVPLVTFGTGFALSCLVTKGRAMRILTTQIRYSAYYFRHLQKKYLYPDARNLAGYLSALGLWLIKVPVTAKAVFGRKGIGSALTDLEWYFRENYWAHLMISSFPQIIVLALIWMGHFDAAEEGYAISRLNSFLGPWIIVGFFWMVVTSLKPFLFLGEGIRYAEHTIMPQCLLFSAVTVGAHREWLAIVLLVYSCLAYLMYVRIYRNTQKGDREIFDSFLPLLSRIDRKGVRIFALGPYFWALLYGTGKAKILCPITGMDEKDRKVVSGNYPYPGVTIRELVDRYRIEFLVGSHVSIENYENVLGDGAFSRGDFVLVDSNGAFKIFATNKAALR
jgi:hypothetical protein